MTKRALGKLGADFFFSFLFPLNSFGLEFAFPLLPRPPFGGVTFVFLFKKPNSVGSDVLLAEAVLGLLDCLGFSDR